MRRWGRGVYVHRIVFCVFLTAGCLSFGACTSPTHNSAFLADTQQNNSNSKAAREANERGLALAQEGHVDQAEQAFREALDHDLRHAPSHNNLGLVLLNQGKVYEAAVEFRMANKLDPKATQPLINLARLYERIGWTREAKAQLDLIHETQSPGQTEPNIVP